MIEEPEDDSIVTFSLLKAFLYDNRNRMKGARSFYKSKGIFSFSSTRYGLSLDAPMFLLNYTSASELESHTGKKMYSSISGFGIQFKQDLTLNDLLLKLINFKASNDTDKLVLTDLEIENNVLLAKIRYESEFAGMLLGTNHKVARNITIYPTSKPTAFLVVCEINSSGDYHAAKSYFQNGSFGLPIEIFDFSLENIQSTKTRHQEILKAIGSVETIDLIIKGTKCSFELIGGYEHNGDKAMDLEATIENEAKYFKGIHQISAERDLTSLDSLIEMLEQEAAASLKFFTGLYWSESAKKYLLIGFLFKKEPTLIYYSLRDEENLENFNPQSIEHPKERREFNELIRTVLKEDEIKSLLEDIWVKIYVSLLESKVKGKGVNQKDLAS